MGVDPEEKHRRVAAYLRVPAPVVTDEERLSLYAIYRNESRGDTYEPLESMYQEAKAKQAKRAAEED